MNIIATRQQSTSLIIYLAIKSSRASLREFAFLHLFLSVLNSLAFRRKFKKQKTTFGFHREFCDCTKGKKNNIRIYEIERFDK